tara:strand:- start:2025 stop:2900 length:876 start_codon:yes stop_codon:yes gene_type:complete
MEHIDLDISNYSLEDILKLFDINYDYNANILRNVKKRVLMLHPDKSKLDKEYFLFFSKAYDVLVKILEFRSQQKRSQEVNINYEALDSCEENEEIINKIKKHKNFNKIFNKLFEEMKIDDEEDGYGSWLKSNEDIEEDKEYNNESLEERKKILRNNSIIEYGVIKEYNNFDKMRSKSKSNGFYEGNNILNSKSNLNYDDLKQAHTETLIPVIEEDFRNVKKYNNLEHLKQERNNQILTPLSKKEGISVLNKRENDSIKEGVQKAYEMYKQDEILKKRENQVFYNLKQIKNL